MVRLLLKNVSPHTFTPSVPETSMGGKVSHCSNISRSKKSDSALTLSLSFLLVLWLACTKRSERCKRMRASFPLNSMDGVRNVFSCKTLTAMQDVWEVRFRFLGKTSMYLEMQLKENYLNWAVFVLAEKCRTDHMVGDVRGQLLGRRWLCWQPDFSQMKPLMIKTFSLLPTIQLMWCQALATDEDQHIHTHLLT